MIKKEAYVVAILNDLFVSTQLRMKKLFIISFAFYTITPSMTWSAQEAEKFRTLKVVIPQEDPEECIEWARPQAVVRQQSAEEQKAEMPSNHESLPATTASCMPAPSRPWSVQRFADEYRKLAGPEVEVPTQIYKMGPKNSRLFDASKGAAETIDRHGTRCKLIHVGKGFGNAYKQQNGNLYWPITPSEESPCIKLTKVSADRFIQSPFFWKVTVENGEFVSTPIRDILK